MCSTHFHFYSVGLRKSCMYVAKDAIGIGNVCPIDSKLMWDLVPLVPS